MKAKKPTVEAQLAALRDAPTEAAAREALASAPWLVVAAAAKLAGDEAWYAAADDLVTAYARMEAPKADPLFTARVAILSALSALSRWHEALAARALATRVAPPPGSTEDAAAPMRVAGGLAYVSAGHEDALDVLAQLLCDPAASVRVNAARAIPATGRRDASALLRYVLATGDASEDVVQALAEALLDVQPERAPQFLAALLAVGDPRAEIVAVALGAARATECFEALVQWSNARRPDDRERVGFLPLALLRDDRANAWLVERIASAGARDAVAAARALATFAVDPPIAAAIRAAAAEQTDASARRAILAVVDRQASAP